MSLTKTTSDAVGTIMNHREGITIGAFEINGHPREALLYIVEGVR